MGGTLWKPWLLKRGKEIIRQVSAPNLTHRSTQITTYVFSTKLFRVVQQFGVDPQPRIKILETGLAIKWQWQKIVQVQAEQWKVALFTLLRHCLTPEHPEVFGVPCSHQGKHVLEVQGSVSFSGSTWSCIFIPLVCWARRRLYGQGCSLKEQVWAAGVEGENLSHYYHCYDVLTHMPGVSQRNTIRYKQLGPLTTRKTRRSESREGQRCW